MTQMPANEERQRPSRREFLRRSALTATAMSASTALPHRVHAAGSDVVKIGLIGCGGRGTGAAGQALAADKSVRLVAMADIFQSKVDASRQNLIKQAADQMAVDDDHCFAGFDGGERVIASDADVILIACASRWHPTYLLQGIQAGKHVFVEKPHAIDPPGVRTVMEATKLAKQKGLCLVSGLHFRYDPRVRGVIARVQDGAVGEIQSLEANYMRAPYRIIERPAEMSEIEWQYWNWYHFSWLSGDDVVQSLVHTMDRLAWAMDEVPPLNCHGLAGRSSTFGMQFGNCFDHHALCYEYPGGVKMYGFNRTQYGCFTGMPDLIVGTKGRASMIGGWVEGETNWKYDGPRADGHAIEQQEMIATIRAGGTVNNGEYAAKSTMIALLGQMACYSGKQWTWDDALDSDFQYGPATCDFTIAPPVLPDEKGIYPVPIPGMTKLTKEFFVT